MRVGRLLPAVAVMLVLALSWPAGGASAAVAPLPEVGVHFHCTWTIDSDADRHRVLDALARAGVRTVRIDLGWASFQETGPSIVSQWYVERADRCVDEARARGIEVLAVVHGTPGWANGGREPAVPPSDLGDFARFAEWLAGHFRGRIAAYEVWNEPNPAQAFWKGTTEQYVNMLRLAYPRFKAGDPAAKIVLGAPSTNDDAWIADVYRLGAKSSFDVMATHPYQGVADSPPEHADDGNRWWFTHFPAVVDVMRGHGDEGKEVWFTEFGWSSHDNPPGIPDWQRGVTPQQQADYLERAARYAAGNYPTVTRMFWYTARDRTHSNIQVNNLGILDAGLAPKPVYGALQRSNTRV